MVLRRIVFCFRHLLPSVFSVSAADLDSDFQVVQAVMHEYLVGSTRLVHAGAQTWQTLYSDVFC